MSLEEDLKGRTLALISQQMATWVVEIQRHLTNHQESLVRVLDELQETVARYDEKIDEGAIERAIVEIIAAQPPPPPAAPSGPGFDRLKASVAALEKGASLSEVLTYLVAEVSQFVERVAMFIVKGPSAIGWYAKGIDPPDVVKQVNVPLGADTVFKTVHTSRKAVRLSLASSPGTVQALGRMGRASGSALAIPLVLRDKIAAILYCDTAQSEIREGVGDLIEVLVLFAGKIVDILSVAPKPGVARTASSGTTPERAAAIRAGGDEVRERAGVPRPVAPTAAPAPTPPAAQAAGEGASTVMFNPAAVASLRQSMPSRAPAAASPPPTAVPAAAAVPALGPEVQKAHEDAKRFARLVVSEIKLYNEAKVTEGRRQKDLYERLKEDIERGRQLYTERVTPTIRESTNYFFDELVRILAGGDAGALGPM
jgi:hypothetical protein